LRLLLLLLLVLVLVLVLLVCCSLWERMGLCLVGGPKGVGGCASHGGGGGAGGCSHMREVEEVVRAGGHPRLRTACMVPFLLRSRRSSCYSRISCRGSGLATGVGNRSRRRALITPKQAAVLRVL